MKTPILSVTKVNKHFGGLAAVINVSFDVQTGAVLGLMGPNGAGKSTLLNIISGEYKPDSGTVHFHGHDINGFATTQNLSPGDCQDVSDPPALCQFNGSTKPPGGSRMWKKSWEGCH